MAGPPLTVTRWERQQKKQKKEAKEHAAQCKCECHR